jgi:hypothetical protein
MFICLHLPIQERYHGFFDAEFPATITNAHNQVVYSEQCGYLIPQDHALKWLWRELLVSTMGRQKNPKLAQQILTEIVALKWDSHLSDSLFPGGTAGMLYHFGLHQFALNPGCR